MRRIVEVEQELFGGRATVRLMSEQHHPAGLVAVRAVASLVVLLVGLIAFGVLWGTADLIAQLLAAVTFLPYIGFYLVRASEHLTAKSWTTSVQFLVGLLFPAAACGMSPWLLLLAGERQHGCVVQFVTETEDNRGLKYDHDIRCGHSDLHYASRGEPEGHRGQLLDMFTDPHGVLAPMPVHVVPTGFACVAVAVVGGALLVATVETIRRLGRRTRSAEPLPPGF